VKRVIVTADDLGLTRGINSGIIDAHTRGLVLVWRQARRRGELAALAPKKRGRKPTPVDARDRRIAELQRQLAEMTGRAQRAEALGPTLRDETRLP
jgi:hypothetical protein